MDRTVEVCLQAASDQERISILPDPEEDILNNLLDILKAYELIGIDAEGLIVFMEHDIKPFFVTFA